ncbi:MAG: Response regulator rcp1 [Phycisphaerae bacterium]|nr:Response regulator rcp1 [Phycisphaerae bacterium]
MTRRDGGPAIVLLVDDDVADQELTRRVLRDDVINTDLRVVSDGAAALDYLLRRGAFAAGGRAPRPDLILLDLNMPRVDGKQVLREMRNHATLRSIPVVVLTTSRQEEDIIRSYNLGCNSFISKPVTIDGFMQTIRQLGTYWFELVRLPEPAEEEEA